MKKLLIFLSLVCDVALAKPYNCSAISFGEAPQKLLAVFDIEPNGGKPQEVVVSSPDTAKLWCYGQQTSDSIRLVCAIGDYSIQKVAPTASIRDGSDLLRACPSIS